MSNYEKLVSKSPEELADWLSKYGMFDDSPWVKNFDENYCKKCAPVYNREGRECAFCELNGDKCVMLNNSDAPDEKQMLLIWLSSESES